MLRPAVLQAQVEAAAEDEEDQLEDTAALIRRHRYHCVQLEGLLRLLENEQVMSRLAAGRVDEDLRDQLYVHVCPGCRELWHATWRLCSARQES